MDAAPPEILDGSTSHCRAFFIFVIPLRRQPQFSGPEGKRKRHWGYPQDTQATRRNRLCSCPIRPSFNRCVDSFQEPFHLRSFSKRSLYSQPLMKFSLDALLRAFSRLHFSSGELPSQPVGAANRTASYQNLPVSFNKTGRNGDHARGVRLKEKDRRQGVKRLPRQG